MDRSTRFLGLALAGALFVSLLTSCGGGAALGKQPDLGLLSPPLTVVVIHLNGWDITLVSTEELSELKLFFDNGSVETYSLQGLSGNVHSTNPAQMTYMKATTKGGDYWYFDRSGIWLPEGYKPKILSRAKPPAGKSSSTVWINDSQLEVSSTDAYCEVKIGYADGSVQTIDTSESSGVYDLAFVNDNIEAVRITLSSDGSKWYFDGAGQTLGQSSKWYTDLD